jgi:hypothetical protein
MNTTDLFRQLTHAPDEVAAHKVFVNHIADLAPYARSSYVHALTFAFHSMKTRSIGTSFEKWRENMCVELATRAEIERELDDDKSRHRAS